jgi:hypothetical protein
MAIQRTEANSKRQRKLTTTRKPSKKLQVRMTQILKPQTLDPPNFITRILGVIDEIQKIKSAFAIDTFPNHAKDNVVTLFRHKVALKPIRTELVSAEETDDIENDIRRAVCLMLSGSGPNTFQRCSSTLVAMNTLWEFYREIIPEYYNLTPFDEMCLDQLGIQFMEIVKPMEFGEVTCDALFRSFSDFLNPECSLTREQASFHLSCLYGNYYFAHDHSVLVGTLVRTCLMCPYWENRRRRARGIGT